MTFISYFDDGVQDVGNGEVQEVHKAFATARETVPVKDTGRTKPLMTERSSSGGGAANIEDHKINAPSMSTGVLQESRFQNIDEPCTQEDTKVIWQHGSPIASATSENSSGLGDRDNVKDRLKRDCEPDETEPWLTRDCFFSDLPVAVGHILSDVEKSMSSVNVASKNEETIAGLSKSTFLRGSPVMYDRKRILKTPQSRLKSNAKGRKRSRLSSSASKAGRFLREACTLSIEDEEEEHETKQDNAQSDVSARRNQGSNLSMVLNYYCEVNALKDTPELASIVNGPNKLDSSELLVTNGCPEASNSYEKQLHAIPGGSEAKGDQFPWHTGKLVSMQGMGNKDSARDRKLGSVGQGPKEMCTNRMHQIQDNTIDMSFIDNDISMAFWRAGGTPHHAAQKILEKDQCNGRNSSKSSQKIENQVNVDNATKSGMDAMHLNDARVTAPEQCVSTVLATPQRSSCGVYGPHSSPRNLKNTIASPDWGLDLDEDALAFVAKAEQSHALLQHQHEAAVGSGVELKEKLNAYPADDDIKTSCRYSIESVTQGVSHDGGIEIILSLMPRALSAMDGQQIENASCSNKVIAHLQSQWTQGDYRPGDVINLISRSFVRAEDGMLHCYLGDRSHGSMDSILVHFPDFVLAPTQIASANQCLRRAFLMRTIPDNYDSDIGKSAVQGTIWHSFFESILREGYSSSPIDLQAIANKAIKGHVRQLFAVGMKEDEAMRYLEGTFNWTKEWLRRHMKQVRDKCGLAIGAKDQMQVNPSLTVTGHSEEFRITEIVDIEEYIESERFGLNGFIDASVKVRHIGSRQSDGWNKIPPEPLMKDVMAPLELKSGKDRMEHDAQVTKKTFRIESIRHYVGIGLTARKCNPLPYHIALQVLLYLLLMEERYSEGIDFGLMQYLRARSHDTGLKVVRKNMMCIHTLIISRNILVSAFVRGELPPMQETRHSCRWCFQHTNCALRHAADSCVTEDPSSESVIDAFADFSQGNKDSEQYKTLKDLFLSDTRHLTLEDCRFLRHWTKLLDLEASEYSASSGDHVVLFDPEGGDNIEKTNDTGDTGKRNQSRKPDRFRKHIDDLVLKSISDLGKGKGVLFSFESSDGSKIRSSFSVGEMLKLYVTSRSMGAVANRVHLHEISEKEVVVHLEKRLRRGILFPKTMESEPNDKQNRDHDGLRDCEGYFEGEIKNPTSLSSPCHPSLRWKLQKQDIESTIPRMRNFLYKLFTNVAPPDQENSSNPSKRCTLEVELSRVASKLRRLIVRQEPPEPPRPLSLAQDAVVAKEAERFQLNEEQIQAVRSAIGCQDYSLILGMPGAGKTTCVAAMIRTLISLKRRVLLTSYTNTAVDNVLLKLVPFGDIPFMRIGREDRVHHDLRPYCPGGDKYPLTTVDECSRHADEAYVIGTTALGINDPFVQRHVFDVCIVDEAGQITLPATLGPLLRARSFILVGDPYQLPPLVTSRAAEEGGLAQPLFASLAEKHPEAVTALPVQYRMAEDIQVLPNLLVYDGKLRCGSERVAGRTIDLKLNPLVCPRDDVVCGKVDLTEECDRITFREFLVKVRERAIESLPSADPLAHLELDWLWKAIDPRNRVVYLDTSALSSAAEEAHGETVNNPVEAQIVTSLAVSLVTAGLPAASLGAISPYNSQVSLLQRVFKLNDVEGVECLTVDKAQGRDKDCIVVSFVRSNKERCAGKILGDARRVNVAITRAKAKLILVGNAHTLGSLPIFEKLLRECDSRGWSIRLPPKVSFFK